MSEEEQNGSEPPGGLTDLEARVTELEKAVSPPWWVSILRWGGVTLVPAAVVSVVTVYAQSKFAASVELKVSLKKERIYQPGRMRYHVAIKNTGEKAADKVKGFVEVLFEGEILQLLARQAFLNGAYVVDESGQKKNSCLGEQTCRIKFGNLDPDGGTLNLRFETTGLMAVRPEIQYGGKPPTEWSCVGVRNALQRSC